MNLFPCFLSSIDFKYYLTFYTNIFIGFRYAIQEAGELCVCPYVGNQLKSIMLLLWLSL